MQFNSQQRDSIGFGQPHQISEQNLVDLEKVTKYGDKFQQKKLVQQLSKQGFCFVILPPQLQEQSKKVIQCIRPFLQKGQEYDNQYFSAPQYGIQNQTAKTSFSTLTGKFLYPESGILNLIPDKTFSTYQKICDLCKSLDSIAKSIIEKVPGFQSKSSQQKSGNHSQQIQLCHKDEKEQFGMLDIVQYFGNTGYNVKPHVDPGLFSINVFNDTEGLKFQNEKGIWVDSPSGNSSIGVIWNGVFASKISDKKLAQGWHKVCDSYYDRLTMWYEVVIDEQVPLIIREQGLLAMKNQNHLYILKNLEQMEQNPLKKSDIITLIIITQQNQRIPIKITMGAVKLKIENKIGMRVSKSGMLMRSTFNLKRINNNQEQTLEDNIFLDKFGFQDGEELYIQKGEEQDYNDSEKYDEFDEKNAFIPSFVKWRNNNNATQNYNKIQSNLQKNEEKYKETSQQKWSNHF